MNTVYQALVHTPWWVYALFFYLLKVGLDATKPHTTSIRALFIFPSTLLLLSLNSLIRSIQSSSLSFFLYTTTLIIGMAAGWALVKNKNLQFDHKKGIIRLPGTWVTLSIILIIFTTKYYFGYSLATNPSLIENPQFEFSMLGTSGTCTGMLIGRLLCYLYRKKTAPHFDLHTETAGSSTLPHNT